MMVLGFQKKKVWIPKINPPKLLASKKKGQTKIFFARASATVLLGCLFWLVLPAPQQLELWKYCK